VTTESNKLFFLGRDYWDQYVQLNGYAFAPTKKGLKALSASTGITEAELGRTITVFLGA